MSDPLTASTNEGSVPHSPHTSNSFARPPSASRSRPSSALTRQRLEDQQRDAAVDGAMRAMVRDRRNVISACVTAKQTTTTAEDAARADLFQQHRLQRRRVEVMEQYKMRRTRIVAEEDAFRDAGLVTAWRALRTAHASVRFYATEDNARSLIEDDEEREFVDLESSVMMDAEYALWFDECSTSRRACVHALTNAKGAQHWATFASGRDALLAEGAEDFEWIYRHMSQRGADLRHAQEREALCDAELSDRATIADDAAQWRASTAAAESSGRGRLLFAFMFDDEAEQRLRLVAAEGEHWWLHVQAPHVTAIEDLDRLHIENDADGALTHTGAAYRQWIALRLHLDAETVTRQKLESSEAHAIERLRADCLHSRLDAAARTVQRFAASFSQRRMCGEARSSLRDVKRAKTCGIVASILRARWSCGVTQAQRARVATHQIQRFVASRVSVEIAAMKRRHVAVDAALHLHRVFVGYSRRMACGLTLALVRDAEAETALVRTLASMKIQWMYKAFKARRIVREQRAYEQANAHKRAGVTKLQAAARYCLSRKIVACLDEARRRNHIVRLQRIARAMRVRNAMRKLSVALMITRFCQAKVSCQAAYRIAYAEPAMCIQRAVRVHQSKRRREMAVARDAAFRQFRVFNSAALKIQALLHIRRAVTLAARRRHVKAVADERVRVIRHLACAVLFQRIGRGAAARRATGRKLERRVALATRVQAALRARSSEQLRSEHRWSAARNNLSGAAVRVQSVLRSLHSRQHVETPKALSVLFRYHDTIAAARLVQRVGRAFFGRYNTWVVRRLLELMAGRIQRMLRSAHARSRRKELTVVRAARVANQERFTALRMILRAYRLHYARRVAAARKIQRVVLRVGRRRFAERLAARAALAEVHALQRRALCRAEAVAHLYMRSEESDEWHAIIKAFETATIGPQELSPARQRVARAVALAEVDLDEHTANEIDVETTETRNSIVVEYAGELRKIIALWTASKRRAIEAAGQRQVLQLSNGENVTRARVTKRYVEVMRAIVEAFNDSVKRLFASALANIHVHEQLGRQELEATQRHWIDSIARPQAERLAAVVAEALRKKLPSLGAADNDQQPAGSAVKAARSAKQPLVSPSASSDRPVSRQRQLIEQLRARNVQPFGKVNALGQGVDLTPTDLAKIISVKPSAARMLSTPSAVTLHDADLVASSGAPTPPFFMRRLPALLMGTVVLPAEVVDACHTTDDGRLSLATVAHLVTDGAVTAIVKTLRAAPLPVHIDLTSCPLSDNSIMTILEAAIALSLPLESLCLSRNAALTDHGALHIAHRIKLFPTLRFVDLSGTNVSLAKKQLIHHLIDAAERARNASSILTVQNEEVGHDADGQPHVEAPQEAAA